VQYTVRRPRYNIYGDQYLEFFRKLNGRFIIGGDFNAKHAHWGSRLIASKGRQLYQAGVDYGCEFVSTGKPTHWPTDPNKLPHLIQIDEGHNLNSDHSPILLTITEYVITEAQNPILINKYLDWDYFNFLLETKIDLSVPQKQLIN
jgi:hypothetical protein